MSALSELPPTTDSEAWMLYSSHALSTWNARSYEFAAIIFTAKAYPSTLFYSSLRGLVTTLFTLLLSPSVGSFIDQQKSRQGGLNVTIIANRTTVLVCCVLWLFLIHSPNTRDHHEAFPHLISSSVQRHIVFAFVIFFGILERLSGIANMLTMERDWVPAIADPAGLPGTHTLTTLNARMRRIDLICKLFAPLFISAIIEGTSATMAVIFLAASNVFGLIVEPRLADFVFARSAKLQAPRVTTSSPATMTSGPWSRPDRRMKTFFIAQHRHIWAYFTTNAWLPSLSLALLYFSALSYSATFVTWLLSSGFSLLVITLARTVGSIVEVSSTFVAPLGINRLARIKQDQNRVEGSFDDGMEGLMHEMDMEEQPDLQGPREQEHLVGLARSGLWGVMVQFVCLIPVVLSIFSINYKQDIPPPTKSSDDTTLKLILRSMPGPSLLTAITLFGFLSLSRLGLWTFDLCVQELDQILVPKGELSSFAGTETAFASFFELGQWTVVAIFSDPNQFVWVAVVSLVAVGVATIGYAGWHLRLRGHLVHWDKIGGACVGWGKK